MKNILALTLLIGTSTVSLAADCIDGDEFTCNVEREIVRLTNEHRANNNLEPLALSQETALVARDWSTKQAANGDIGHDGFPNARNRVFTTRFGEMTVWLGGENVAMHGGSFASAEEVAAAMDSLWWNSSGHRANMLNGSWKLMGAGIAGADGGWYGTQIFGEPVQP